jgi:hypothetical protein
MEHDGDLAVHQHKQAHWKCIPNGIISDNLIGKKLRVYGDSSF